MCQGNETSERRRDTSVHLFSAKEVQQHCTADDCWIAVEGKVYDVTEWVPRHPGGNLILLKAGEDASSLFESYHPESAHKVLSKFIIGKLKEDEHMDVQYASFRSKFYSTLKSRVAEYFQKNEINPRVSKWMFVKTALILVLVTVAWMSTYMWSTTLPTQVASAVFLGYMIAHIAMSITHDGNHGAFSTVPVLSDLMGQLLNYTGASSHVWKYQHQVGHHAFTNVEGKDPDIRVSEVDIRRVANSQPWHQHHRFQHLYLMVLYALFALKSVTVDDFIILHQGKIGTVRVPFPKGKDLVHFIAGKVFFYGAMLVVPTLVLGHSLQRVLLLAVVALMVEGIQLAFLFQVAHVVSEADFPLPSPDQQHLIERDWAAAQVMTTTNFCENSMLWNTLSGGLCNQIEHHLFPAISHVYFPSIAPIVKDTCKEFGVSYKSFPTFASAVRAHFRHLKHMGLSEKLHMH